MSAKLGRSLVNLVVSAITAAVDEINNLAVVVANARLDRPKRLKDAADAEGDLAALRKRLRPRNEG